MRFPSWENRTLNNIVQASPYAGRVIVVTAVQLGAWEGDATIGVETKFPAGVYHDATCRPTSSTVERQIRHIVDECPPELFEPLAAILENISKDDGWSKRRLKLHVPLPIDTSRHCVDKCAKWNQRPGETVSTVSRRHGRLVASGSKVVQGREATSSERPPTLW